MGVFTPIFGKLQGARGPVRVTGNAGTQKTAPSKTANAGASHGRNGPPQLAAKNAVSTVFQFDETHAKGTYTKVLSTDSDWVGANVVITVTPTGNTLSTQDVLAALTQVQILGPTGPVMTMQPDPDFYFLQQRFNPYHTFVDQVTASGATAETYSAEIPISLPKAMGPYTFQWSVDCSTLTGGATTAGDVEVALSLTSGDASAGQLNYVYANFPATVAANGTQDLAPIAAIQNGVTLTELFISGLSANTTDIATLQIQSSGSTLGPRVTGYNLVSMAQARLGQTIADLTATVPTNNGKALYPLFALQSALVLGRDAHMLFYFGSSPSTSLRLGYCWIVS